MMTGTLVDGQFLHLVQQTGLGEVPSHQMDFNCILQVFFFFNAVVIDKTAETEYKQNF